VSKAFVGLGLCAGMFLGCGDDSGGSTSVVERWTVNDRTPALGATGVSNGVVHSFTLANTFSGDFGWSYGDRHNAGRVSGALTFGSLDGHLYRGQETITWTGPHVHVMAVDPVSSTVLVDPLFEYDVALDPPDASDGPLVDAPDGSDAPVDEPTDSPPDAPAEAGDSSSDAATDMALD